MISSKRWEFAQTAEKAYQEQKVKDAQDDFDRIIGIAERKSNYVVKRLKGLNIEILSEMNAVEIGSGAHGVIWKFPCDFRTAVDPMADFYFEEFKKLQNNGTTIISAKGEDIPLPDNSADIVLSENVLDHTHSPQQVLYEVKRLLKPGGTFYFAVDTNSLPWVCMSKIYNYIFNAGLHLNTRAFPAHPHHFSKDTVFRMFANAGLTIIFKQVRRPKNKTRTFNQTILKLLGEEEILEIVARAD